MTAPGNGLVGIDPVHGVDPHADTPGGYPGPQGYPIINGNMPDMAAKTLNGTAHPTGIRSTPPAAPPQGGARRTAKAIAPTTAKKRRGRGFQKALTIMVAGVAIGGSATGMWAFFGDVFHIHNLYERGALFAAFEGALLACALAERTSRINAAERAAEREAERKRGNDVPEPEQRPFPTEAIAVWVMATITGLLSASNEASWPGRFGRVALPLLAAFMVHRAISNEASDLAPRRPRINWRYGPERLFVLLGLADAEVTDVADVERTRRIGRLATLRYRAETARLFKGRARRRYNKALSIANERYGLANAPKLVAQLEAATALLYTAFESTAPAMIAAASPWGAGRARSASGTVAAAQRQPEGHQVTVRATSTGSRGAVTVQPVMEKPPRRSPTELLHAYFAVRAQHPTETNDVLANLLGLKDSTSIRQARRKEPDLWAQLAGSLGPQTAADNPST